MAWLPSKLLHSLALGDTETFSKLFTSTLHSLNSQTARHTVSGQNDGGSGCEAWESVMFGQAPLG